MTPKDLTCVFATAEVVVHNFVVELDSFSLTESQLAVECSVVAVVDDDGDEAMMVQQKTVMIVVVDLSLIAKCR